MSADAERRASEYLELEICRAQGESLHDAIVAAIGDELEDANTEISQLFEASGDGEYFGEDDEIAHGLEAEDFAYREGDSYIIGQVKSCQQDGRHDAIARQLHHFEQRVQGMAGQVDARYAIIAQLEPQHASNIDQLFEDRQIEQCRIEIRIYEMEAGDDGVVQDCFAYYKYGGRRDKPRTLTSTPPALPGREILLSSSRAVVTV
jgi:hypothetical protein